MTPIEQLKEDLQDTRESFLRTASSVSRFSSVRERYYTDRANECAAQLAAVEALEADLESTRRALEIEVAENAKLRDALEPFASEAGEWSTDYQKYPDSDAVVCQGFDHDGDPLKAMFNLGDLRRAAQVLAETNARKEGNA